MRATLRIINGDDDDPYPCSASPETAKAMWTMTSVVLSDTVPVLIENNAALRVVLSFTAVIKMLALMVGLCSIRTHLVLRI